MCDVAVLGCDDLGVTVEWRGHPDAMPDWIARAAQQEADRWPSMGLLYMLVCAAQVAE